jgi:hypothetical protein
MSPATPWNTARTAPGSPIHRSPAPTSVRRSIRWSTSCATPSSRTVNTTAASGAPGKVFLNYPFLTGRSTRGSQLVGELMIQVLAKDVRRYGW